MWKPLLALLFLALPTLAQAAVWQVDHAKSHLRFAGEHAGSPFEGAFEKWQASIDFDPSAPEKATVKVVVDLASATTGDATYDGTLPEADWLNSAIQQQAIFESTAIRHISDSHYEAKGVLQLRGKKVPVILPFSLTIAANGHAEMKGRTTLKRLDFGIGKASDAAGEWVSLDIPLDIAIIATQP